MSQTVDRALQILEYLQDGEHSLAEIADMLGVHKTTALRLTQTLESRGFARHDGTHRYRLGSKLFRMASMSLGELDLRSFAAPHLRRLSEQTRQTIHLGAYDHGEVFYIDKFEAQKSVRMYSRIGAPAPLHCTGVAKAIIAQLPRAEQIRIAKQIEYVRHTERTITNSTDFLKELERTRELGYAMDDREHEDFIHCVAAPVRVEGLPVAHGISISATTITLTRDKLLDLVPLLQETARAIGSDVS